MNRLLRCYSRCWSPPADFACRISENFSIQSSFLSGEVRAASRPCSSGFRQVYLNLHPKSGRAPSKEKHQGFCLCDALIIDNFCCMHGFHWKGYTTEHGVQRERRIFKKACGQHHFRSNYPFPGIQVASNAREPTEKSFRESWNVPIDASTRELPVIDNTHLPTYALPEV